MPMSAHHAVVRDNRFVITLRGDNLDPAWIRINADDRILAALSWPEDFSIAQMGDDYSGTVTLPVPTADEPPITGITVSNDTSVLTTDETWHLRNLYATTEADFERKYYRIKNRIKDPETLIFAMGQIMEHYNLDESHRCVAAVVYAYKSLDINKADKLDRSVAYLDFQRTRSDALKVTGEGRTDREHLRYSLSMPYWHILMIQGKFAELNSYLDGIIEQSKSLAVPMFSTPFNVNRMLLLAMYLAIARGELQRAEDIAMLSYEYYISAYKIAESNTVRFSEMKEAHYAVSLGLQSRDRILNQKKSLDTATIFDAVNRIRSEPGLSVLRQKFVEAVRFNNGLKA
jgi:hypothetical protein